MKNKTATAKLLFYLQFISQSGHTLVIDKWVDSDFQFWRRRCSDVRTETPQYQKHLPNYTQVKRNLHGKA